MKKHNAVKNLALALGSAALLWGSNFLQALDTLPAAAGAAADRVVSVMTRNVYHGVDAEFAQATGATTFLQFLTAVGAVFQGYYARNFPERAAALAAEIDAAQPDLIGLQEVVLVGTDQTPPQLDGPATPATAVALDYLQILLDALAARGVHYAPVIALTGLDIEAPSILGFDVRHTEREVILARTDLPT